MRLMMLTLLASISAHLSVSQNIESGKSHELQVDEYRFPLNSYDKNFSLDTAWNKPEARLHGDIGRKRFKSGEKPFQSDRYTNYNQRLEAGMGMNSYFPFDKMPCMKPYGLFRMHVIKPDADWRFPILIK
jgi:hypothetical protein